MWQPKQPWRKCRWRICKIRQKFRKQFWKSTPCLVKWESVSCFSSLFLILHLGRGERFEKTKIHSGQNSYKKSHHAWNKRTTNIFFENSDFRAKIWHIILSLIFEFWCLKVWIFALKIRTVIFGIFYIIRPNFRKTFKDNFLTCRQNDLTLKTIFKRSIWWKIVQVTVQWGVKWNWSLLGQKLFQG